MPAPFLLGPHRPIAQAPTRLRLRVEGGPVSLRSRSSAMPSEVAIPRHPRRCYTAARKPCCGYGTTPHLSSLPMALPPEGLTRGLALVRYLYDLALQQSRQSGLRRATAILTFHDAVEMFLVLGLQHHDAYNDKKLYQFHEYWKELALKDVHLTQQGAMASFSRIRANFKHHAILPSSTAIEDARVHVRDFLTENIPIVFGANFEDISLASTISFFERTRTFLEQA